MTRASQWWYFLEQGNRFPATGDFRAVSAERIGRLYFPLANDAGMLSWTSPRLQGGPAAGHHTYLSPPLTAEDLPHTLVHRDFWLVEPGKPPFSASGLSPSGLLASLEAPSRQPSSWIDAGIGWWSLTRLDPNRRYTVRVSLWCPADVNARLECMWVEVVNTSSSSLTLMPYAAIPCFARSADNVRDHRHVTALLHRASVQRHGVTVRPTLSFDERGHAPNTTRYSVLAFGPGGKPPAAIWPTEAAFLGEQGSYASPAVVWNGLRAGARQGAVVAGHEAIGGFRFSPCTLAPGKRAGFFLLSGISDDPGDAERWTRWARSRAAWPQSLANTKEHWRRRTSRIAFLTADRTLDHWLAWVSAQPALRRLYGNSYLPQFDYGRGGRGWRDLWQDCLALLLADPVPVRPRLLQHIGGVRIDGSNATIIGKDGAFFADRNNIPRTWMDHGAWPLHTILLYIDQTGDLDILREPREYFRDPQLVRCRRQDARWNESYGFQLRTRRGALYRGSVLEHLLIQALTAFFNVGEHHLCRLEGADWNDGLDMASHRGESAAFSAFYAWNLERLARLILRLASRGQARIELAEEVVMLLDRLPGQARVNYRSRRAKQARLARYLDTVASDVSGRTVRVPGEALARDLLAKHQDLAARLRRQEWVRTARGSWFNGYYDDRGARVEGVRGSRVRMTLTGQVFPLMAGIATEQQVEQTIRSVERFLRDPHSGGIRLNSDFGGVQPALGRAFSFAYGEKENGAVFSHMAVMYASALYARRRPREGRKVWSTLYRMAMNQPAAKIFPCLPEYFNAEGRGLYCYLTGSASWLIYLLLTQAYGVRGDLGDLVLDPQLTREDFGAGAVLTVQAVFAARPLRITFRNSARLEAGAYAVTSVTIGRKPIACAVRPDGGVCIARAAIARLPAHRDTCLDVTLSRRR